MLHRPLPICFRRNSLANIDYFPPLPSGTERLPFHRIRIKGRDIVSVLDRSASMNLPDQQSGPAKMDVARDAAELFVQPLRPDLNSRAGLASFSSDAALHQQIASVDDARATALASCCNRSLCPKSGGLSEMIRICKWPADRLPDNLIKIHQRNSKLA